MISVSRGSRRLVSILGASAFRAMVAVVVAATLTPILWAISMSFKRPQDVFQRPIKYLPDPFTFANYAVSWTRNHFSLYFMNSLLVACVAVVAILFLSVFNGYALSRFRFRGRRLFMLLLLCTQLMPVIIFIIPLFLVFKGIGLINTHASVIIFYVVAQVPFNSLLMKSFIGGVPKEIDEAAMIDGAGRWRIMASIVPPVILPGIVATTSFAFIGCWNEFQVAFSFLTSASKFTIPIGLKYLISESAVELSALASGSVIALLPPLILFAYVQRYLVSGLSAGAVKG